MNIFSLMYFIPRQFSFFYFHLIQVPFILYRGPGGGVDLTVSISHPGYADFEHHVATIYEDDYFQSSSVVFSLSPELMVSLVAANVTGTRLCTRYKTLRHTATNGVVKGQLLSKKKKHFAT